MDDNYFEARATLAKKQAVSSIEATAGKRTTERVNVSQRAAEGDGGARKKPGRLPETRRRTVLALLVAACSLLRRHSVLVFPNCHQHLFEGRALIFDRDFCLRPAIASVDDHSRCGELHCGRDRLIIHNRENLVERGGRALTRKVNQFSFLPRQAASVWRSTATQPTPVSVSLRRENFNRASHVSHVPLFARVAQARAVKQFDLHSALWHRAAPNQTRALPELHSEHR
jgi:hypothetical protein